MHSNKKDDFIEKILSLDGQSQSVLMKIIENNENQLTVVKDTQLVLDKINDLENANEELVMRLQGSQEENNDLNAIIQAMKREAKCLEEECEKMRKEKTEALR